MNAPRRNRRQDAPATPKVAQQEPEATEQDAPVQAAEPDAAPEETATQVAVTPEPEPEPEQPAPDAPAAEPEAPAAEPQEQQDVPGDGAEGSGSPEPDAQADGPAQERREPTAGELLAIAASTDPAVQQETRTQAYVAAAGMMLRGLLGKIAALPEDQPVTGDHMTLYISGANGRGVAGAKAALQVIIALFGSGFYEGSTHDSIKADASRADRKMRVYAFLPDLFREEFALLMQVLNDDGGLVWRVEQAERKRRADIKKASGLPAGVTEYQWFNVSSRNVMTAYGADIAARIAAQFPADDPQVAEIRKALAASIAARGLRPMTKDSREPYPVTGKYAVAPEPAQVLVGAQA